MMDLTRRSLLRSILIGGPLLSIGGAANAALLMGDRYTRLVAATRDIVEATPMVRDMLRANPRGYRQQALDMVDFDAKADLLLHILNTEFSNIPTSGRLFDETRVKVQALFHNPQTIDVLSERELRGLEDAVVTVATLRYLIATVRAPLSTRRPGFEIFSDRYASYIFERDHPSLSKA